MPFPLNGARQQLGVVACMSQICAKRAVLRAAWSTAVRRSNEAPQRGRVGVGVAGGRYQHERERTDIESLQEQLHGCVEVVAVCSEEDPVERGELLAHFSVVDIATHNGNNSFPVLDSVVHFPVANLADACV